MSTASWLYLQAVPDLHLPLLKKRHTDRAFPGGPDDVPTMLPLLGDIGEALWGRWLDTNTCADAKSEDEAADDDEDDDDS